MATWSEYDEKSGEYGEGDIGEASCPHCGYPMLAKYSNGELVEIIGSCPACGGSE